MSANSGRATRKPQSAPSALARLMEGAKSCSNSAASTSTATQRRPQDGIVGTSLDDTQAFCRWSAILREVACSSSESHRPSHSSSGSYSDEDLAAAAQPNLPAFCCPADETFPPFPCDILLSIIDSCEAATTDVLEHCNTAPDSQLSSCCITVIKPPVASRPPPIMDDGDLELLLHSSRERPDHDDLAWGALVDEAWAVTVGAHQPLLPEVKMKWTASLAKYWDVVRVVHRRSSESCDSPATAPCGSCGSSNSSRDVWSGLYPPPVFPDTAYSREYSRLSFWLQTWSGMNKEESGDGEGKSVEPAEAKLSERNDALPSDTLEGVFYDDRGQRLSARIARKEALERAREEQEEQERRRQRGYYIAQGANSGEQGTCSNVAVLCGPCGVGKTSAVYSAAAQLGYRVVEINPSLKRCPKTIEKLFSEATQCRQILVNGERHTTIIAQELARMAASSARKASAEVINDDEPERKSTEQDSAAKQPSKRGRKKRQRAADASDDLDSKSANEASLPKDDRKKADAKKADPKEQKAAAKVTKEVLHNFFFGAAVKAPPAATQQPPAATAPPSASSGSGSLPPAAANPQAINVDDQPKQTAVIEVEPPVSKSNGRPSASCPQLGAPKTEVERRPESEPANAPRHVVPSFETVKCDKAGKSPSVLVLVESGDVEFEDECGFLHTVRRVAEGSKVPVVVTTNECALPSKVARLFGPQTPCASLEGPDALTILLEAVVIASAEGVIPPYPPSCEKAALKMQEEARRAIRLVESFLRPEEISQPMAWLRCSSARFDARRAINRLQYLSSLSKEEDPILRQRTNKRGREQEADLHETVSGAAPTEKLCSQLHAVDSIFHIHHTQHLANTRLLHNRLFVAAALEASLPHVCRRTETDVTRQASSFSEPRGSCDGVQDDDDNSVGGASLSSPSCDNSGESGELGFAFTRYEDNALAHSLAVFHETAFDCRDVEEGLHTPDDPSPSVQQTTPLHGRAATQVACLVASCVSRCPPPSFFEAQCHSFG